MAILDDLKSMPTSGKLMLAGAVVVVGALAFIMYKNSQNKGNTTSTTPTTGSPAGNAAADQMIANGQANYATTSQLTKGLQGLTGLVNSKHILTSEGQVQQELNTIEQQLNHGKGFSGGAHMGKGAMSVYHPLQSATLFSKRPYRG